MRCILAHKSQRRSHKCTCYREAPLLQCIIADLEVAIIVAAAAFSFQHFIPPWHSSSSHSRLKIQFPNIKSLVDLEGMYLKQSWCRLQSLGGIIAPSHTGQTATASKMCENRAHWFDCATVCWDFPSQLIRQRWTMLCRPIKGRWTLERTRDNLTFGQIQSSRLHAFNILWNGHFSGLEPDNYSFYRK